jgi:hypothetical protein
LVSLLLCQGPATLQQLARARPRRLHDWSLLPLLRAGYWEAADLWAEWARAVLTTLPPPAAGTLHLIAAPTLRGKTGQQQPWAHHTRRLNQPEPFVFGPSVLLMLAPWGRLRIPSRWVPSCWLRSARVNRTSRYAVCGGSFSRRADADAWWGCSLMPALPARPTCAGHPAPRRGLPLLPAAPRETGRRHALARLGPSLAQGPLSSCGLLHARPLPPG